MAIIEIQTRIDLPAYEQLVKLDGVNYLIALYFNPRINNDEGRWFITLGDKNRNLIVAPVPIVVNWPLFDRFIEFPIPPGTIFAFDTSGQNKDPLQFDLGSRVRLFYAQKAN